MATGKSFDLKNQKKTQKLGKTLGLFKDISFIVIMLNREVQLHVPREESFLIYKIQIIELNSPRRNIRSGWRIGEKPKTSEAKTNSNVLIMQGRTEFCTLLQLFARIRSDEKILRKLFTSFRTRCLVSRHSVSVRQNSSSNPKNPGSTKNSQVWASEERSTNSDVVLVSELRGSESYV